MYHLMNQPQLTTNTMLGIYIREIDNNIKKAKITCINTKETQKVDLCVNDTSCALFENLTPCTTYDFKADVQLLDDSWIELQITTFKTLVGEPTYIQYDADSPPPSGMPSSPKLHTEINTPSPHHNKTLPKGLVEGKNACSLEV